MPRCRPEAGPQEKASVGVPRVAIETGKVLRTAVSARPRVGSQARSKARDSRSLPEGVPRFESWPTHHPFAPNCARSECTPTRQKVSFRELSPPSTGLRSAFFRLRPEGSEQDDHPDEPEADSRCDERHEWLGMAATRVRAFLDETESQEHEQQADPDD